MENRTEQKKISRSEPTLSVLAFDEQLFRCFKRAKLHSKSGFTQSDHLEFSLKFRGRFLK